MFADVATAKEILGEYFNEPGVELLLRLMHTAIGFKPIEGSSEPALGATRIGGTPDLPAAESWPVRPVAADAEAIGARGGSRHGPHIRKLLARPTPFGFLAQVDLAEAAALGTSPASCRQMLRPPTRNTLETQPDNKEADAEFIEALQDENFEASIDALFDDHHVYGAARQQLLGLPLPEQDDPRYSAVVTTELGVQFLTPETARESWPRIAAAAPQWRLLLQIDMQDYLQQPYVEGTVYFLIRRDDLAARAFDKVVAIYQQT